MVSQGVSIAVIFSIYWAFYVILFQFIIPSLTSSYGTIDWIYLFAPIAVGAAAIISDKVLYKRRK